MQISRRTLLTGLTATTLIAPTIAHAREPEVFQANGIAINGTDPVAYFKSRMPESGMAKHSVDWKGATWQFDSAENAEAFAADPMAHAPAFGGYCAYAASLGYLAPTVPEAWTIYEGVLYLNASLRARELWLKDPHGNIAKGQTNWPGILG